MSRDRCAMDQRNALTSAELKRRGIAAIEQALQLQASRAHGAEASALQWLLTLPPSMNPRRKAEIDAELAAESDF